MLSVISEDEGIQLSNFEILRASSWLHECGKFINFPRYHRHSMYLIMNSSLMGFSQRERQMIGLIARFQRKGTASTENYDCQGLNESDLMRVKLLSGILRIGAAANRTRSGFIKGVEIKIDNDEIVFEIVSNGSNSSDVDYVNILREKGKLEKILGMRIKVDN